MGALIRKNAAWYRSQLIARAHNHLPRPVWNALLRMKGHKIADRPAWRDATYQGVKTRHNARPLHVGRFAEIYDRWAPLNSHIDSDTMRYRTYNVCQIAARCIQISGDFVCIGVSFGVVPRVVYDFVNLAGTEKTLHLIDPFNATGGEDGDNRSYYNTDPEVVASQYQDGARIEIHRDYAPAALDHVPGPIAFAFLDTGHTPSDVASIAALYPRMSEGGGIITDRYAGVDGNFKFFDPVFERLGTEPFWFPSGQGAIFK